MDNGKELALKITELIDKAPNVTIKRRVQKRNGFKIQQGRNAITMGRRVYLEVYAFNGELPLFSIRTVDKYSGPSKKGIPDLFNAKLTDFQLGNRVWANPTSVYYHWKTNKTVRNGRVHSSDYVTSIAHIVRYTDGAEIITPEDLYWAWETGPRLRAIWGNKIDRDEEHEEETQETSSNNDFNTDNSIFENTGTPIDIEDSDDVF